jgi:hypothetical protein
VVRGRHAHAWPEVYFDKIGWVAFEPTTGRGNPEASTYTGVPPEQATAPAAQAATTTTAPSTTVAGATPATSTPAGNGLDAIRDPAATSTGTDGSSSTAWWIALAVAAAVLVGVGLVRLGAAGRHRRRLRADPHGGRIAAAWVDATRWLAVTGVRPDQDETPLEFSERVRIEGTLDAQGQDRDRGDGAGPDAEPAAAGPIAADDPLGTLAWAETVRRFGVGEPSDELSDSAELAAATIRERVKEGTPRSRRIRHLVG